MTATSGDRETPATLNNSKEMKASEDVDLWRDTPVRLLGYANEVGESFRYIFPRMVKPSYGLAFAYTFGDVYDKGQRAYIADGKKVTQ